MTFIQKLEFIYRYQTEILYFHTFEKEGSIMITFNSYVKTLILKEFQQEIEELTFRIFNSLDLNSFLWLELNEKTVIKLQMQFYNKVSEYFQKGFI